MPNSTFPQGEGEQLKWVEVDSNSIASVAFDTDKFTLHVKFTSGSEWMYADVPQHKFKRLVYAPSSGAYLRKEIIPHHVGSKVQHGESARSEGTNHSSVVPGPSSSS